MTTQEEKIQWSGGLSESLVEGSGMLPTIYSFPVYALSAYCAAGTELSKH